MLTFSDAASGMLPYSGTGVPISSGTYLPTNPLGLRFGGVTNATSFSAFNGLVANGDWTLAVFDTAPIDGGSIAGGWSLNFTTTAAVPEPAAWGMMIGGFGLAGGALRRRKVALVRAA
jgi:hypothetical protein